MNIIITLIATHHNLIAIIILFSFVLACLLRFFFKQHEIKQFEPFLKVHNSDNVKTTIEITANRIQFLIEQTLQQIAIIEEARSNRENLRIQTRNIYSAVLIALFTLIFLKDIFNDDARPLICLIAILFSVIMYYYDVHSVDMMTRITAPNDQNADAYRTLINISPADTALYSLDYSSIKRVNDINDNESLKRKLINSLYPTLEQAIFYLLPIMVFTLLLFGEK